MKKFNMLLTIVLFLQIFVAQGQSLDRSVIGVGGYSLVKENVVLSFTIGETAVSTLSGPTLIVTEGFQQPGIQKLISGIDEIIFINGLQVYPNPTPDLLHLGIPVDDPLKISAALFDMLGKKVFATDQLELIGNQYQLDLTGLPTGVYLLAVGLNNGEVQRNFKVQKIQ